MTRRRRWWSVAAGIILGLLVIVFIAAPFLVPVDAIRDKVLASVRHATGRDLAINGPVSLTLFPVLGVTAQQVSLSNPPWAGPEPMVQIAKLTVRLKTLPLLSGKVAIDSFVLDQPQIDLKTDREGRKNWQFASSQGSEKRQPAEQSTTTLPITQGRISINDGRIAYSSDGERQTVDNVDLTIEMDNPDAPLSANGSARWRDHKIDLTMTATTAGSFLKGTGSQLNANLASDAVKLAFQGTAGLTGETKAEGQIDLSSPSLRHLIAWVSGPSSSLPPNGLGPLSVKGQAVVAGKRATIKDLQFSLDAIKATGQLTVDSGGPRPSLSGRLAVDRLDLNPYLPPEEPKKPSGPWSTKPIDASALQLLDADLTLSAGSIAYRKFDFGKTEAAVNITDGRLAARLEQMALYQGNLQGRLTLIASAQPLALEANATLARLQAGPLLTAMNGSAVLQGTASGDLSLASRGRNEADLIRALHGRGRMSLTEGVLKGVDLAAAIRNALAGGGAAGGDTQFSDISGSYTIANGVVRNQDLNITSPVLQVAGTGTVNLPDKSVDYRLVPRVAPALQGKAIPKELAEGKVAVLVRGPWNSPSYSPDLSGITAQQLDKMVGKQLGGLLGGEKSGKDEELAGTPPPAPKSPGGIHLPIPLPLPGLGK